MKTLSDIKKRIDLRRATLRQALYNIVNQLKAMGALRVVVFGSFVADKVRPGSDLDILVIMPASKTGKEWLKQIYSEIDKKVACDFFAFNKKEYDDSKRRNIFLKEILKKGRVVYEKRTQGRGKEVVNPGK